MKIVQKIFVIALVAVAQVAFGQKYFYAGLDISKPLSNTQWIDKGGAQALRLGFRTFITDRFSAGIDVGSVSFHAYKPYQTVVTESGAITTDWFNYMYSYTGVISGQYNFPIGDADRFMPYVGVGAGANHTEFVQYYNTYSDQDAGWGFLVRPEAGMLVKFGSRRSMGLVGSVHYDYSTNTSEKYGYNNLSLVGFQLGLMFFEL